MAVTIAPATPPPTACLTYCQASDIAKQMDEAAGE
jgi:hypothetical protein